MDLDWHNRPAHLLSTVAVSLATAAVAQGCVDDSVYVLEPPGEPADALGEKGRGGLRPASGRRSIRGARPSR